MIVNMVYSDINKHETAPMASPKKPFDQLSRTAKYYRLNPKARAKKAKTDKKINARSEQKKKRSELASKRRKMIAAGIDLRGRDLSHTKAGIKLKSVSANRGSKKDTKGDKKSRGKKR